LTLSTKSYILSPGASQDDDNSVISLDGQ